MMPYCYYKEITRSTMMKLLKFRVTNFRSVADSGWIETDDVTALIGTNEAGKTNLLIPLWKLKPAKGGAINAIADYPRKRYHEIRAMEKKPVFIEAHFELDDSLVEQIVSLTGATADDVRVASVTRDLSSSIRVTLPNQKAINSVPAAAVLDSLVSAHTDINGLEGGEEEEGVKVTTLATLKSAQSGLTSTSEPVGLDDLKRIKADLVSVHPQSTDDGAEIISRLGQAVDAVAELETRASGRLPTSNQDVVNLVWANTPSFVYYSNYGNLDSEIYLPHVIDNMERTNLGSREQAKARTLKVLFEFVNLQPKEILELGHGSPIVITKTITK